MAHDPVGIPLRVAPTSSLLQLGGELFANVNLQQVPLIDDRCPPAGVCLGEQLTQDEVLAPHLHVVAHSVDGIPAVPDLVPEPRVLLPEPVYLLLVQAFALAGTLRIIDEADVQPWIEVRLGRRAPEPIAARLGITVDALRMRLARADERLARAVAEGGLTGVASTGSVAATTAQAIRGTSIRAGRASARGAGTRGVAIAA